MSLWPRIKCGWIDRHSRQLNIRLTRVVLWCLPLTRFANHAPMKRLVYIWIDRCTTALACNSYVRSDSLTTSCEARLLRSEGIPCILKACENNSRSLLCSLASQSTSLIYDNLGEEVELKFSIFNFKFRILEFKLKCLNRI